MKPVKIHNFNDSNLSDDDLADALTPRVFYETIHINHRTLQSFTVDHVEKVHLTKEQRVAMVKSFREFRENSIIQISEAEYERNQINLPTLEKLGLFNFEITD